MTDRPILFSAAMVLALLQGRKTQTRRLKLGLIAPGDRLWVREAWRAGETWDAKPPSEIPDRAIVLYEADQLTNSADTRYLVFGKLRQSMFMPRRFSRLTLTVYNVRFQRLHDLNREDAVAEGIEWRENCWGTWNPDGTMRCGGSDDPIEAFRCLWININGADSWETNPEVVALTFSTLPFNIDSAALDLTASKPAKAGCGVKPA